MVATDVPEDVLKLLNEYAEIISEDFQRIQMFLLMLENKVSVLYLL